MRMMRLGIDASNIRGGGGLTHLVELLRAASPGAHRFDSVVVWGPAATLARLKDEPWLLKRCEPALESNYFLRALWQRRRLGKLASAEGCDLLFVPGGTYLTRFRPIVTMSRNLLPFEWKELLRYGFSPTGLRLLLLRAAQSRSFRGASGTIFLTEHARRVVIQVAGTLSGETRTIPHGLDVSFFHREHRHDSIAGRSSSAPFRLLYVSIIDLYKHQWHVAEAVARLRQEGLPVSLTFVGPAYPSALRRLRKAMDRLDPDGIFLHYPGPSPHHQLPAQYESADLCVFASSCENMPNILLEGMASGLPVACSNRGSMPEVLGDAGIYFDPESPDDIASALRQMICSPQLRLESARAAVQRARQYSWARCAGETFAFLSAIAARHNGVPMLRQTT